MLHRHIASTLVRMAPLVLFACGTPDVAPTGGGGGSGGLTLPRSDGGGGISIPSGNGGASGGGGGAGPGGGPSMAMAACARESRQGKPMPLDLFVLLDQSGSMTENEDRWTPVSNAVVAFADSGSLAGTGLGVQYFPLGAQVKNDPVICAGSTYATPDVPIADLPGNAAAVKSSIQRHAFTKADFDAPAHSGTPTLAAVQGVMTYLRPWADAHPDRKTVLLLATDGVPSNACRGNNVTAVAAALAQEARAARPIQTFVIGIGRIDNLNVMAEGGGTGRPAFLVDAGGGTRTQQEFLQALEQIRADALPCAYGIPAPSGGTIDPQKVNVEVSTAGSAPSVIGRVSDAQACPMGQSAWYYDDPARPSQVLLCPAACEVLKRGGARIDLVFGCQTRVIE